MGQFCHVTAEGGVVSDGAHSLALGGPDVGWALRFVNKPWCDQPSLEISPFRLIFALEMIGSVSSQALWGLFAALRGIAGLVTEYFVLRTKYW